MENEKLFSVFSHLSIWFAPVILPGVMYFLSETEYAQRHSKYAFAYHLVAMVLAISSGFIMHSNTSLGMATFLIAGILVFILPIAFTAKIIRQK